MQYLICRITYFPFFLFSSASQLSGIEAEEEAGSERVATYKVGMLGASEVGKTALTAQFTTSDYICAYDASLGKHVAAFTLALFPFNSNLIRHSGRINSIPSNRNVTNSQTISRDATLSGINSRD